MVSLKNVSFASLASALLLAGCATAPQDDGASAAAAQISARQQEYLNAFNAPRNPVRATQTGIRPGYTFVGIAETDIAEPLNWRILAPNGAVAAEGMTIPQGFHEGSNANIQLVITDAHVLQMDVQMDARIYVHMCAYVDALHRCICRCGYMCTCAHM